MVNQTAQYWVGKVYLENRSAETLQPNLGCLGILPPRVHLLAQVDATYTQVGLQECIGTKTALEQLIIVQAPFAK